MNLIEMCVYASLKLTANATENGWLEDETFPFWAKKNISKMPYFQPQTLLLVSGFGQFVSSPPGHWMASGLLSYKC